ncbi:hypothetical protein [Nonomuraea sp. NPDC005650]|uniref:hypothetical protein n=1 Tax=Nonomuraea sp. NPDC005650 TaxID=3157045 RepID=UPI0033AE461A
MFATDKVPTCVPQASVHDNVAVEVGGHAFSAGEEAGPFALGGKRSGGMTRESFSSKIPG